MTATPPDTAAARPRTTLLPRAEPADVGVPPAALLALLDGLAARSLELHSLMVLRRGRVVAEGWWAPYTPERVHLLYSLSKSFTSSAVGFCVAEGRFALDDRVVDLLPDHVPAPLDERVASLTVHHLLSMSTGHRDDTLDPAWRLEPHDLVKGFLRMPPEEPVGSRHAYNNSTTYVLAALVERHTGMPLLDYLRPRLLDPLGISAAHWDVDEHGQALGFSGLHLQTESIATFGQLLLQDGRWDGEQVLPEGWVALATRSHVDNDDDPSRPVDWRQGYGYQYWMARHGFRGDGAFGQFCVVVPEQDLVVATTACVEDMQAVLDTVWERLLPALDAPDEGGSGAALALRERLAALALPTVRATDEGPDRAVTFTVPAGRPDTTVANDGTDAQLAPFAAGTTLEVSRGRDGQALVLTLPSAAGDPIRLELGCGRDRWVDGHLLGPGTPRRSRGVPADQPTPVACRGGWTGPDTFEADLVLIETPHRIRLRGNGARLEASWNLPPLSGARLEHHLPA